MTTIRHYLDWNATAPLLPQAADAMRTVMAMTGNPSSIHGEGRAAAALLEAARAGVAGLAGVPVNAVHFTGSGTEANNWALVAFPDRRVITTAIEHDSVLKKAGAIGAEILPARPDGRVDLSALSDALAGGGPALVSVMAANNETGVIQPLAEIAGLCLAHDALLHVDAVQAAGKIDLSPIAGVAALMTLSGHKIGAPAGVGALIIRRDLDPAPLILGGGQEQRRRAGTQNLIGISGFGVAARMARQNLDHNSSLMQALQVRLEQALRKLCPDVEIAGADDGDWSDGVGGARLPNTTCVRMPGVPAETQVMALDLAGIAVSAGSACSSGKVTPSHVLRAMSWSDQAAAEAIRISTGPDTSAANIDALLHAWADIWNRRRPAA